jgi:hypothetical protein
VTTLLSELGRGTQSWKRRVVAGVRASLSVRAVLVFSELVDACSSLDGPRRGALGRQDDDEHNARLKEKRIDGYQPGAWGPPALGQGLVGVASTRGARWFEEANRTQHRYASHWTASVDWNM